MNYLHIKRRITATAHEKQIHDVVSRKYEIYEVWIYLHVFMMWFESMYLLNGVGCEVIWCLWIHQTCSSKESSSQSKYKQVYFLSSFLFKLFFRSFLSVLVINIFLKCCKGGREVRIVCFML